MALTIIRVACCVALSIGVCALTGDLLPIAGAAGNGESDNVFNASAPPLARLAFVVAFQDDQREGQRRSEEAKDGQRRTGEGEGRRAAEGEGRREGGNPLSQFRPQTQREAVLYEMIVQLQREVAALKREVQNRQGPVRDGNPYGTRPSEARGPRDGDRPATNPRWQYSKEGKVFKAYDKNGDATVTLDEWLAMTNGNISEARRAVQTKRFQEAEPSGDGKFTPEEFIYWYSKGRFENTAEGRRDGDRDGQRSGSGGRDGEGKRRGLRDGESERSGSRDGESSTERSSIDRDRE